MEKGNLKKCIGILFFCFYCMIAVNGQNENQMDSLYNTALKIKFLNPEKAVEEYTKYYKSALLKNDTLSAIKGLLEIGTIYSHNVNYSKAYDHLWQALLLADKHEKVMLKGRVYQELGWLYGFFNRKKEALKHFNLSKQISKELIRKKRAPYIYIFTDYFGLANYYRVNNKFDLYVQQLDSCLAVKNKIQGLHKNYYLEAELGYKLMLEKKYEKAIKKLNTSKEFFKEKSRTYLVVVEHLLGKVYKEKGDYSKSIQSYERSLEISNKYHCHADYRIMSYDDLVELYKIKKDYKKALFYQGKSKEMNERIFGSKTESNQELLLLKDSFREAKESREKIKRQDKIKILEQEKYISFLKLTFTIVLSVLALVFVFFFIGSIRRKHKLEKNNIKEVQRLEIEKNKEILELKNKELTASALQLIEIEEFLKELQEKLSKQNESVNTKVVSKMINTIQGSSNSNWKEFETRFTLINQNFYEQLRVKFPKLSQTDLKICALIKLNFTSKEMASLLGISVESIHTSRYRLRKKLNLVKEQSLTVFINSI